MKKFLVLTLSVVLAASSSLAAQTVDVVGGQTSVLLDTDVLSSVGLDLSSVSGDTIVPGNLGDASVAFGINPRDAASLPTTFSYDPNDFLNSFSGTIEHTGSVFFNTDTVEVGNFTIGFDANRVGGDNSGFFVESTTGVEAILFDVGLISNLDPQANSLTIQGALLVSPEFAGFLGDTGLTGAEVGGALVQGVSVPEPSAFALCGLVSFGLLRRKR